MEQLVVNALGIRLGAGLEAFPQVSPIADGKTGPAKRRFE